MVADAPARLLAVLDGHRAHLGSDRLARIEWLYYPRLRHAPNYRAPNLYRLLLEDPECFASLVELAYRPAGASSSDRPEPSEDQRRLALNAYRVLDSWPASQFAPGIDGEGPVDAEQLNAWVDHARERLAQIDRTASGDRMIGRALAASPPDPNDDWPGLAVRDLLETLQSDKLENGLLVAVVNQRGPTWRSPTDGGDQERRLADDYRERSRRLSEWPRTAALLSALARRYDHEADIEDREAEAERRGLPV